MAIGIAAIAVVLTLTSAYNNGLDNPIAGFSPDLIGVCRLRPQGQIFESLTITESDLKAISKCPGVAAATTYSLTVYDYQLGREYADQGLYRFKPRPKCRYLAVVECDPYLPKVIPVRLRSGSFIMPGDLGYPRRVCVLSPEAAIAFFDTTACLGKTITMNGYEKLKVIGITDSVSHWPDEYGQIARHMKWPFVFMPPMGVDSFSSEPKTVVKVKQGHSVSSAINSVRAVLSMKYPHDRIKVFCFYQQLMNNPTVKSRMVMLWTVGSLGALFLFVTGLGIAGLFMFTVTQRRREIGIRMALGASPGRMLFALIGEALCVAVIGAGLGLLSAVLLAYFSQAERYLAPELLVRTITLACLFSLVTSLSAAFYPSLLGIRMTPAEALKE